MSFSQNIKIEKINNEFIIKIKSYEIEILYNKYKGYLNIEIKKPIFKGTDEQNKAFHSLIQAYYNTGMHSAPKGITLQQFKLYIKINHGICYDMIHRCTIIKIPKSWADYSKIERSETIESLISEIEESGAIEDKKIQEILSGMKDKKLM